MKNDNRERCQHVSGVGALGERGEPHELFHVFEDAFQEPEIDDKFTKDALYKVPGSLAPPGESDKGIEDKCRFRWFTLVLRWCDFVWQFTNLELAMTFDTILKYSYV